MVIVGVWRRSDDGITRPMVLAHVTGPNEIIHVEWFLVDSGADCTAFSAGLLSKLGWTLDQASSGYSLQGIGGSSSVVEGTATIELPRSDGEPARIRGSYCAFTDPMATEISVLGRDILYHFDVILSRRRNEVLLLSGNHQYQVTEG